MKKKAGKINEPAAIYHPAKPRVSRSAGGTTKTAHDEAAFQRAVDKVFAERKELLRKLAQ